MNKDLHYTCILVFHNNIIVYRHLINARLISKMGFLYYLTNRADVFSRSKDSTTNLQAEGEHYILLLYNF